MKKEIKVGAKPKYKEGTETLKYIRLIPKKRVSEMDKALEKIVEKDKR